MLVLASEAHVAHLAIWFLLIGVPFQDGLSGVERFEQALYKEDTLGDLEGALLLYQEVSSDESLARPIRAKALFRMAKCTLKRGRKQEAWGLFAHLITVYSDQKTLVEQATRIVPPEILEITIPTRSEGRSFMPEPWVHGELLIYRLQDTRGNQGLLKLEVHKAIYEGRNAWHLQARANVGTYVGRSSVYFEQQTLQPISSTMTLAGRGVLEAKFTNKKVIFKVTHSEKTHRKETLLDQVRYPAGQAVAVIRSTPLSDNFEDKGHYFLEIIGQSFDLPLKVTSREMLQTPLGNLECFRVETMLNQPIWRQTEAPYYIVKMFVAGDLYQLIGAYNQEKEAILPWTSEDGKLRINYPYGWYPGATETPNQWEILPPDALVRLHLDRSDGPTDPFEEHSKKDTELANYRLLKDPGPNAHGGLELLAAYGAERHLWRYSIHKEDMWLTLTATMPKDRWPVYENLLKELMASIQ